MSSPYRHCEDENCGAEVPRGQQRFRCTDCGKLVCAWCIGHVHSLIKAGLEPKYRPENCR